LRAFGLSGEMAFRKKGGKTFGRKGVSMGCGNEWGPLRFLFAFLWALSFLSGLGKKKYLGG